MMIAQTARRRAARCLISAIVVMDVWVLACTRPDPGALGRGLSGPHRWVAESGTDAVTMQLAGALLWLAAWWLALGWTAALVGALPGRCAVAAQRLSGAMLPPLLRRLTAAALGAAVIASGVAAVAEPAYRSAGHAASSHPVALAPWPTTPTHPHHAVPWPTTPAPARPRTRVSVVVAPGDSLWQIAAHRLGPHASDVDINAEWRRWYAANRARIGANPDLIQPGLRLYAPRAEETP
ncbi:MAG: LysM peptidoglycan-binding domain-containing protein [Jatrophihabitans sp.]